MAASKANKQAGMVAVDLPECPVCLETMCAPIYQCSSGHSLCCSCTNTLNPPICPICRQPMTQMRNWQLEEIIMKAKVPCPNKSAGCLYTINNVDIENHLKECIFRQMECPLGAVFGRCSWNGKLKEMMDHFKERHPTNCNVTSDTEVELENINVQEDERCVYLFVQGKLHFIITFKIDTLQKMAYWTVQLIGGKTIAYQHIFEIHLTSKQDSRRKVVFIEHCFNDAIKADDVFRLNKCAVLPLATLKNFISGKNMSFRFFIKRVTPANKDNKTRGGKNENNAPNNATVGKGPNANRSGPHPPHNNVSGPRGPWPKGPGHGPKGAMPKKNKNAQN